MANGVARRWTGQQPNAADLDRLAESSGLTDRSIVEQLAREMHDKHDTFWTTATRWEPLVYWRSRAFAGQFVNVDEAGLRRTATVDAPDSSVRRPTRLAFFGGSTMWGSGVRDEHTIPSLVARRLHDAGHSVEAINYGQLGYVSTQEWLTLALEIQQGRAPDVAVFYDGFNDVSSASWNERGGVPVDEFQRPHDFQLAREANLSALARRFVQQSPLARLARGELVPTEALRVRTIERLHHASPEEIAETAVRTWFENVRIARAIGQVVGCQTLFYWQPTVYDKAWRTPTEEQIADANGTAEFRQVVRQRWRAAAHERREDSAEAEDVLDLSDVFNAPEWRDRTAYFDVCHVSEPGNATIAERLATDLARLWDQQNRGQKGAEQATDAAPFELPLDAKSP